MKNVLTGLLTLLMLPFTVVASIAIVALLLSMTALLFPILIIGGALVAAGKISNKLTEWLFPPENIALKAGNGPLITSLLTTAALFLLFLAPVAVASAATAAIVSVLLVPIMAGYGAYSIANQAIDRLFNALNINKEETRIEHSYSILPQNPDDALEIASKAHFEQQDVPHYSSLFQRKLNHTNNQIINSNEVVKDKETLSPS